MFLILYIQQLLFSIVTLRKIGECYLSILRLELHKKVAK